MTGFSSSSVCLFLCLIPTSLKKRYCTSWKRLRWDQVRSNTRKYTLHVLTCIPKSPSMSGTRTSAADLIHLNSLTATAWLTVSNEQVRQKSVPFWCHRSKQASLLVPDLQWSLAPPTCSKIENILVLAKIAAWEHRKYLWSRHLSDFSTWNTLRRIVRFSALILFLTSPSHDLHYMHTWWMRRHCSKLIQLLGNARRWNANRQGQNMLFLKSSFSFDAFAVFFVDCRHANSIVC